MTDRFTIAGRAVGPGKPSFVIAEAGVNHNGSLELAHKMIDVAADARVDAIKFQSFDPEKLAAPEAAKAEYQVHNTGEEGSQLEMLRKLSLPQNFYPELIRHAAERGVIFLSTAFDHDSADFLDSLQMPAFKLSSGDLTNYPLLLRTAKYGKPMILSTGMATLEQVETAVNALRQANPPPLAILHCVTSYPADPADCNLRAMETMRARFDVPIGWSDHTTGFDVTVAAVALGATIIEKHFTLDRALPGPDHAASLEPDELLAMMTAIRRVESSLGNGVKKPTAGEIAVTAVATRSLFWKKGLRRGDVIGEEDLIALRPGTGISPAKIGSYVGRVLVRGTQAGAMLSEADIAGGAA